jgi:hypothetical protein
MITNEQYLVQRLAEAKEKMNEYSSDAKSSLYWKGVQDTYHRILSESFPGWAAAGTVGYYVHNYNMAYDAALERSAPVEYIFNFVGGGWNTVYAHSIDAAIAKAVAEYESPKLMVDIKSFRRSTPADLNANLANFN